MLHEPLCGVCVSVGYSDYLDISLSHNRPLLDFVCVVTSKEDADTQRVAGKHNCALIVSDDHRKGGCDVRFNKGAMIERGLLQMPQSGWRVHFDADVIFPGNFRQHLGQALYDPEAIYGADRFNVVGWEGYQKLVASGFTSRGFEHHHFLSYPICRGEVGGRLVYGDQGWVPVGFLQIWNSRVESSGIYRTRGYPTHSSSAAHDDVQFSLRWNRDKRVLIPEVFVAHCVTEDVSYGKNWNGRKSAPFGPPGTKQPKAGFNPGRDDGAAAKASRVGIFCPDDGAPSAGVG